jgi:hypothetical protein
MSPALESQAAVSGFIQEAGCLDPMTLVALAGDT